TAPPSGSSVSHPIACGRGDSAAASCRRCRVAMTQGSCLQIKSSCLYYHAAPTLLAAPGRHPTWRVPTEDGGRPMNRLTLLIVLRACFAARADEPRKKEGMSPLRAQYRLAAGKYEFFLDKDRKVPLALEPEPVFHWSSDNDWSGDVFVWMAK